MAPSLTDYLHGLRRLWWLPVLTLIVGLGIGLFFVSTARPTTETRGNILFTFRIDDPGQEAAGSARIAESEVAQGRLSGYTTIARTSQQVQDLLATADINTEPTYFSPTGTFRSASARALIDSSPTTSGSGLVEVRVRNGALSQERAAQLVTALSEEVARQALAIDAQQPRPSLRPDPLIARPQAVEGPASRMMMLALPVLVLTMLGFGLTYLMIWRQGRIYARRDIEERVGARVLGDLAGRPADAAAIVLALTKGRESGTRALIVSIDGSSKSSIAGLGENLSAAGRALGLEVSLASLDTSIPQRVPVTAAEPLKYAGEAPGAARLALIGAPDGLNANALLAAGTVDIVALVVAYGKTSYGDVNAAGRTLAEVTDTDVAVIGLLSRAAT